MHKQAIPIAMRMAMGVASNEMLRRHHGQRIGRLEEEAEIVNALARRAELERQARTIAAMRYSQAPIILKPGGRHPSFGYEVPVGSDQGMVRTAAEEIGRQMAHKEVAFRKQSMRLGTKVGLGATAAMVGLGGLGIAADKGVRATDKHLMRSQWGGQPIKLGAALVDLHDSMDKEAVSRLGRVFRAGRNRRASIPTPNARPPRPAAGVPQAPTAPAAGARPPAQAGGHARGTVQADPFPASSAPPRPAAPQAAAPAAAPTARAGGFEEGVKRWGNKWVAGPARFAAKHPGLTAAGAIGVPAMAYGGYRAATAGIDVMQQRNPQYTYNTGGYQLPTNVSGHGYTQAPTLRY